MDPNDLILEWILWHHAVEYIKQDLPKVESMELKLPLFAGWVIRQLGSKAYVKEQETAKELKAQGIRIVKKKFDQGELFVVWAHRGNTDIFRIREGKLRAEVQKKIDELIQSDISKEDPPQL